VSGQTAGTESKCHTSHYLLIFVAGAITRTREAGTS